MNYCAKVVGILGGIIRSGTVVRLFLVIAKSTITLREKYAETLGFKSHKAT